MDSLPSSYALLSTLSVTSDRAAPSRFDFSSARAFKASLEGSKPTAPQDVKAFLEEVIAQAGNTLDLSPAGAATVSWVASTIETFVHEEITSDRGRHKIFGVTTDEVYDRIRELIHQAGAHSPSGAERVRELGAHITELSAQVHSLSGAITGAYSDTSRPFDETRVSTATKSIEARCAEMDTLTSIFQTLTKALNYQLKFLKKDAEGTTPFKRLKERVSSNLAILAEVAKAPKMVFEQTKRELALIRAEATPMGEVTANSYAKYRFSGDESLYRRMKVATDRLKVLQDTAPSLASRATKLLSETPAIPLPSGVPVQQPHVQALVAGLESKDHALIDQALKSLEILKGTNGTSFLEFYYDKFYEHDPLVCFEEPLPAPSYDEFKALISDPAHNQQFKVFFSKEVHVYYPALIK